MAQINGWVETTQTGMGHKAMQNIGIVGDRIVYMQVEARTNVDFDGPAADK
jgi:protein dispatched 1